MKLLFKFMFFFSKKKKIFGSFGHGQSPERSGERAKLSEHFPKSWFTKLSLLTLRC